MEGEGWSQELGIGDRVRFEGGGGFSVCCLPFAHLTPAIYGNRNMVYMSYQPYLLLILLLFISQFFFN